MKITKYFHILIVFQIVNFITKVFAQSEIKVHYACNKPGLFALTFDDGPHPNGTAEVLDILKELNVTATFFINGFGSWEEDMSRYEASLRRTLAEGHQIGSHSWAHSNLTSLTVEGIRNELKRLDNLYFDILKVRPTILRPPYGEYNQQLLEIARNEFNYEIVIWNIDTQDWSHPGNTLEGMKDYYLALNETRGESYIAIHHDVKEGAAALANSAIKYMKTQGFKIVTLAECIGIEKYQ